MRFVAAAILLIAAAAVILLLTQSRTSQTQRAIPPRAATPFGHLAGDSSAATMHPKSLVGTPTPYSTAQASPLVVRGGSLPPLDAGTKTIAFTFASPLPQIKTHPQPRGALLPAGAPIASENPHPDLPPNVPYASNTDPVRIESISISSDTVHAGDIASGTVITTSNAASVTARVGTYQVSVPRSAPGTFSLSLKVPRVPLLGQQVNIVVTAIRSDGQTDQRTIPIRVYL